MSECTHYKARCIDIGSTNTLTINKVYTITHQVTKHSGHYLRVQKNDYGVPEEYFTRRFEREPNGVELMMRVV